MKKYFINNKNICIKYLFLMIMNGLIPVFSAQWITWVTGYALGENDELVNLALSLAFMSGYTIIVYLSYDRIKRKYKESMMIEIEQEMMDAVVLQPQQSFHRYDSSSIHHFFLMTLKCWKIHISLKSQL